MTVEPPIRPGIGPGIRPLVIGHRGASAVRPENTLEAFRHAAELGADWIELDVRRTAEGRLAVHHDATLPDGRVIVEVAAADLPASVPSLAAALDACAGLGVNVEIKNDPADPDHDPTDGVAAQVAELLTSRAASGATELDRILVTSFNPRTVAAVHERAPAVRTGLLAFDLSDPRAVVERALEGGHVSLNPWEPFVDEALMALTRDAGLLVYPWTTDDPVRMAVLLDLGVDGIITNVPDVGRSVVDARG